MMGPGLPSSTEFGRDRAVREDERLDVAHAIGAVRRTFAQVLDDIGSRGSVERDEVFAP